MCDGQSEILEKGLVSLESNHSHLHFPMSGDNCLYRIAVTEAGHDTAVIS